MLYTKKEMTEKKQQSATEKKWAVIHKNGIKTDNRACNLEWVEVTKNTSKNGK